MEKPLQEETTGLIEGGKVMSLFDHLSELRFRIVISLTGIFILFCIALFFSSPILVFLREPLVAALPNGVNALHFTGPLDVFLSQIKISFLTAIVLGSPLYLYQFWAFVEPAMYKHERKMILPFTVMSVVLFFLGILFCYLIILPLTLHFLINLGMEVGTPIITITDYISILSVMIFGFGIVFETPLVLVLLGVLGVVDAEMLRKVRRYVIVGVLIVGALLTPPDPLSQIGMAIPLYLMYEVAIVIISALEKRRKKTP